MAAGGRGGAILSAHLEHALFVAAYMSVAEGN
jgi:hypothetical protein